VSSGDERVTGEEGMTPHFGPIGPVEGNVGAWKRRRRQRSFPSRPRRKGTGWGAKKRMWGEDDRFEKGGLITDI